MEAREIKVDKHQQMVLLNTMLVLFNLFIAAAVLTLVFYIKKWYIAVFDIVIVAFCVYKSVRTSLTAIKSYKYEIKDNLLIVNSIWYDTTIDLASIYKIAPKKYLWDRQFKRNSNTLCIYFYDGGYYKVNLYNISEDVGDLIADIMDRVVKLKNLRRDL